MLFSFMGQRSREIQNEILKNLPPNKRLFPINAGMGWQGEILRHSGGIIIIKNPRPLHAGPAGWPDLCGWETVEITPEMVGQKIAVFCAEEIKAGKDTMKKKQKTFHEIITSMGGIFRIIRD